MSKFGFLKTHTTLLRKLLGAVIVLSVGLSIAHAEEIDMSPLSLQNGLDKPYPAPAISGIDAWINSEPLQISDLKGKVILIDFWTYSCINCMRTLPYLNAWYEKYHKDGLVIIGVHTPEFDFEKTFENVKNAVMQDGIKYPVALDSHFSTWQNFSNQYWPAHYLIDKNGNVVYTHFGEGDYQVTENNIRYLLNMDDPVTTETSGEYQSSENQTPETYLGYSRAKNFSSLEPVSKETTAKYTFPKALSQNEWALQGSWKVMPDRIISDEKNAAIKINFNARKVYIVMGNATNKDIRVKLLLNGNKITLDKGRDVLNGVVDVNKHTLYDVIEFSQASNGILLVIASSPGLEVYTFTFG